MGTPRVPRNGAGVVFPVSSSKTEAAAVPALGLTLPVFSP